MNESMNTVGGKPFWRAGGFVYETTKGNFIRCVRGIPIGRELWMHGEGRSGEPTNDNVKGGRNPLQEEYKAKRLGKSNEESDVLWSTGKRFASHHDIANRPYEACSYGIGQAVKSSPARKSRPIYQDMPASKIPARLQLPTCRRRRRSSL